MPKKYKLGIAFSGGGAKAAAHCGAVQALKEFGIRPDILAGTSAGSLVAAFYSAGMEPKRMIELFRGMTFFKDIVEPSSPSGGLFDSAPLLEIIRKYLPVKNFEELPIPVYAIASDMEHGKIKVFSKGELAPRLVASCSIPIVFKPIVIDGIHYIDGGVFQNLPVPSIRNLCEKVIAFSVRRMEEEPYKPSLLATATRAYSMMFMSNIMADSRLADLYIELNTNGCSVYDIDNAEKLFRNGYEDACKALEDAGYTRIMEPEEIAFKESEKYSPLEMELRERAMELREKTDQFIDYAEDVIDNYKNTLKQRRSEKLQRRCAHRNQENH